MSGDRAMRCAVVHDDVLYVRETSGAGLPRQLSSCRAHSLLTRTRFKLATSGAFFAEVPHGRIHNAVGARGCLDVRQRKSSASSTTEKSVSGSLLGDSTV